MHKKHTVALAISALAITAIMGVGVRSIIKNANSNSETNGSVQPVVIAGCVHQSDHKEFDWSVYEDPSRPEFWDDGDGAPPRPLRYLAAHPTKENAARVKRWLALQIEVIGRVARLLQEDDGKEPALNSSLEIRQQPESLLHTVGLKDEGRNKSLEKVRVVNIYRSGCQACQRSKETIQKLQAAGAQILHVQTDFGKLPALYEGSREYTKEFQEHFSYDVTPTLYVKIEGKEPEMIEGYVDYQSLQNHLIDLLGEDEDAKK